MTKVMNIKIEGKLDPKWETWFNGMKITHVGEHTIISGEIKDSAHIHGVLDRIRDLNLKLISVNPIKENNNQ